jgi:hypothetical protein
MKKLTMTNTNSLERMEFEFEHQLPMSQRERLAMEEVFRLRKELKNREQKKTVAKNRSRTSGDS